MKKSCLAILASFVSISLFLTGCHTALANQAVNSSSDISGSDQTMAEDNATDSSAVSGTENTVDGTFGLSSLKMMNASTGWACSNSSIYRTADGGSHWVNVTPKYAVQPQCTRSFYLNADTAWSAVSFKSDSKITVFRTDDGGKSWTSVQIASDNSSMFSASLNFVNTKCGWLMIQPDHGMNSEPGQLFSTTDGGITWSLTATAVGSESQYNTKSDKNPLPFGGRVSFCNPETGWVSGSFTTTSANKLFRTLDGGRTWKQQSLSLPANLSDGNLDVSAPPTLFSDNSKDGVLTASCNPKSGTSADFNEIFYITHDGGTTWQAIKTIPGLKTPTNFVNSKEWWCWSSNPHDSNSTAPVQGNFYTTDNAGETWKEINPDKTLSELLDKGQNISEIDFIDSKTGWVLMSANDIAPHTLFKTVDGGNTWMRMYI